MLDEKALRKPGFAEGVPVRLCDGHVWHFARPVVNRAYPVRGSDGRTKLVEGYDRGAEYDRLTDAYTEMEPSDHFGQVAVLADLAFHLLSENYAIAFDQLREVLWLESGRADDFTAVWQNVAAVALGRAPKAMPVGEPPL